MRVGVGVVVLWLLLAPGLALSQDPESQPQPFTLAEEEPAEPDESGTDAETFVFRLGQRAWFSTGSAGFHFAGLGGSPNVRSDLQWKNVDSNVLELHAETIVKNQVLLRAVYGYGAMGGGTFRDQDFDGDNRTQLFSDSISSANDDHLWFVTVDLGYRLWQGAYRDGAPRSSVDLLIGYQHWKERYQATRTTILVSDSGPTGPINPGVALTNEYTWDSLRIGGRTEIELDHGFSIRALALFIPWMNIHVRDVHHFRGDLAQNPSIDGGATGGFGFQGEATIAYRIWRTFSIEAGYQGWYMRSGSGTLVFHASTPGGDAVVPLNVVQSFRHGAILGLHYSF